ncbi:MAG: MFS transporter [Cytophagales bacterium]|nr:MFS transporter [Bernardetiaceae bacterium]MDW8206101.1 MFS transporter [Cytophagales bacterium]
MKNIFYGWWVLLALVLIYMVTNGILLNTMPLFTPQLLDEFNLDNQQVSRPAQILYLMVAFLAAFVGILLDKYSPKAVMLAGAIILLIGLAGFASAGSFLHIQIAYVLYAFALTLAGIVTSMYLITQWFVKYRGLAVGIFLMGSSFGGALFNKIAGWGIAVVGWRNAAWILLGCAVVGMLLPLVLLVRNKPSDMGLLPDGATTTHFSAYAQTNHTGISLAEAVRKPYFYLLLIATATLWFCITGVVNHQVLFIEKDLQQTKEMVTNVTALFFLCSIVGKLLFGWLGDRYNKLFIMLLSIVNLLIGTVLLRYLASLPPAMMYVYAVVYGIAFSGAFTMIQVVVAEVYNGNSYGKILGIFTMVDTLAGSMGIRVLGVMRKDSGSYIDSFNVMIVLCIFACLCVLALQFMKKPQISPSTIAT